MATEDARPATGFSFHPPDHVLIDDFLRPKLAGLPIHGRFHIHDADAYSVSPDDLLENREQAPGTDKHDGKRGDWYFFSPARCHQTSTKTKGGRRQRAVGEAGHTWHTEGCEIPVLDDAGKRVGYKRKLSYGIYELQPGAKAPKLTRLGWCMTEFCLDDPGAGLVLCKVYVSTHKKTTTYASVMKATADSKKRKAGEDPHPDAPTPKSQQGHQEPVPQLEEIERWMLSDEDDTVPVGAVDDGSVDPAGFFTDLLQDVQGFRAEAAQVRGAPAQPWHGAAAMPCTGAGVHLVC